MILRAIQTFIKDPKPVENADAVVPGLNIIEGRVKLIEPIRSPVRGMGCAAFFYRSFLFIPSGRGGSPPMMHKIKQAEGYASFVLEMKGGEIAVVPAKPGNFTQRDHQDLQKRYGAQFQGVEETVMPGAIVRVRGKVTIKDGKKTILMKEIILLEKQVSSQTASVGRKKQRNK